MSGTPDATAEYPGIRIEYFTRPYRRYDLNGDKVPSVSQALGILNKPALLYYAERVTAEGVRTLARYKGYRFPGDMTIPNGAKGYRLPKRVTESPTNGTWLFRWGDMDAIAKDDPKSLIRLGKGNDTLTGTRITIGHLAQLGIDHRSETGKDAERGVGVHSVLEDWATTQKIPNVADFPEVQRGYIRGLSKWLMEWQPAFVEAELMIGSAVHGFAGRRDTVLEIDAASLPASVTGARDFPDSARDGGRILGDLKTSKGIYPNSHYPQLAGYELGAVECGIPATVAQCIVNVHADGDCEIGWSDAEPEDFLTVLAAYKSQQRWGRRR